MSGPADDKERRIREQLDRILSSTTFSGSERHRQFLRFVVEQSLKGDTDKLNEFVLGFEVFNKSDSFDPRIDSIVRVEARRLRERLRKYYQEEGAHDSIVITLRPRSFVPDFAEPSAAEVTTRSTRRAWLASHKTAAVAVAALLCGAVATALLLPLRWKRPPIPTTTSIVVLPFQTLSAAAEQEVLGDAIADTIITGLAGIPGLRVISRGSGIQFKESGRSPAQLATDLRIDYIVEGTVQVKDGHARVSAKLTDTRSQSYVWAETRETEITALAELERGLTEAIASRVRLPLPPGGGDWVRRRRAATFESYGAFLKGQYYWYQADSASAEKSIALFEEATRGDPKYAPAWAWLSQGYMVQILRDDGRDAALIAKGRQAATTALALDDQLAEADAAVGSYAALDWNWSEAERYFRRAIQLDPGWAQGHLMYALMYLLPHRQLPEAVREVLRAHELDPVTRTTRLMLEEVFYFNREYSRAIAESEDPLKPRTAPSPGDRVYFLSLSLSGQGKRALAELSAAVPPGQDTSPASGVLGYLLAKHGDRRQALALRQRLAQQSTRTYVSPLSLALISVGLDDKDEAFRQLLTAVARRVPASCQITVDPVFDPLRSDPRYAEVVRGMGLKAAE